MALQPITAEKLRIGLYIKIEGSWFSHPFSVNTFKIKYQKELETLRGLRRVKLLFDPDKSDPEEEHSEKNLPENRHDQNNRDDSTVSSNTEGVTEPQDKVSDIIHENAPDPEVGSSEAAPTCDNDGSLSTTAATESMIQHKFEMRKDFHKYQQQLKKVEAEYKEVLREGKVMLNDLTAGHPKGLSTAKKMISSLNDILLDADSSRALMNLIGSNETGDEFLFHSLNVCTLSIAIARDFGMNRNAIEKLAMGAMLHDIGELKYSAEMLLRKSTTSSSETKAVLKKHPKYGKEILSQFNNFPYEALDIVAQHHERLNGSGYPLGIKGEMINQLAKIVMVADEYDELVNHPDPMRCLTPSEALSHLYSRQRGALWDEAITRLIRQLGVYPPGSIVVLNTGQIGLVTSVNSEARLRPILMVYSEDIPKEEAMIVNLAEESEITIKEAIRPGELSTEVREYLNPRRLISYYPSVPDEEDDSSNAENMLAQVTASSASFHS